MSPRTSDPMYRHVFLASLLCLAVLTGCATAPTPPQGAVTLPDGSRYEGGTNGGFFHGKGTLSTTDGARYEGDFIRGRFHGRGTYTSAAGDVYHGDFVEGELTGRARIRYANGNSWDGEVRRWAPEGRGTYVLASGRRYTGEFSGGVPAGQVIVEHESGTRYEGGIQGWEAFHGPGVFTGNGGTWRGTFENGRPTGVFSVEREGGERYTGEIRKHDYHGSGRLVQADGTVYTGEFAFGRFHGEGTLEYVDADGHPRTVSGPWQNGLYAGEDAARYVRDGIARLDGERILFEQPRLLREALGRLEPQRAGIPDLYFVAFGSHGSEDVFMREVRHATGAMTARFGAAVRTLALVNNPETAHDTPLASITNLEAALQGIADRMDTGEDILFLYLTSHGSESHVLSVTLDGVPLRGLSAPHLARIIEDTGIRWKVILVSACFSGGFIEHLRDEHTLVMTSASADRTSFGCSNESELTWFGRAFFGDALPRSRSIPTAFEAARALVTEWEVRGDFTPSNPQIALTPAIATRLEGLRPRTAPTFD